MRCDTPPTCFCDTPPLSASQTLRPRSSPPLSPPVLSKSGRKAGRVMGLPRDCFCAIGSRRLSRTGAPITPDPRPLLPCRFSMDTPPLSASQTLRPRSSPPLSPPVLSKSGRKAGRVMGLPRDCFCAIGSRRLSRTGAPITPDPRPLLPCRFSMARKAKIAADLGTVPARSRPGRTGESVRAAPAGAALRPGYRAARAVGGSNAGSAVAGVLFRP